MRDIVEIQMKKIKQYLKQKKIDIILSDAAKDYIATIGYDPVYGARPLRRVFQKQILDALAIKLIDGTFKEGDTIEVDYKDGKIIFNKLVKAEIA